MTDDTPPERPPRERIETLRRSEERFRLLVEGVTDYAIFMLDPGGFVTSWNAGARRLKGYEPHEIIGQHFSVFYPQEALDRRYPWYELEVAEREGRYEDEGWRIRKDGTQFWANVVITALREPSGKHVGFSKITRDLTERRRLEILEHEGQQITEFLAMLGHELRNPLAPIRNAVEIIRARDVKDPSVVWARDLIDRQVTHLSRLVEDLLDMSRITSGKITLQKEPLDFAVLVSRVVESTRSLLEGRKHTLSLTLPNEPLRVEGDATRLSQVVLNLVNNAAKYTPKGGQIGVLVQRQADRAVLTVRDNGMGMSSDFIPRVFDLFVQGERAMDRSEGGLGVGLSLVRKLVGYHGGTVEAFSPGPGRGSEFIVRLPALARPLPEVLPVAKPASSSHPSCGRRVLVVDDNNDSVDTMALLLRIWGHDVHVASDGPAALAAAAEWRPEVVLLDIGLPGMTGYEIAPRMREIPGMAHATLVAMTGYSQDEDRRRSREAGFAVHLAKPVDPETLQKILADLEIPSAKIDA